MPRDILPADINQMSAILTGIEKSISEDMKRSQNIMERFQDVKSYDEVKKEGLPKVYGSVVDTYYEVCTMLTSHVQLLMEMRVLRKQVKALASLPSLESQTRARIEVIVKDLEDSRSSLLYLKEAFDAKLRFYNSCQFMMTGTAYKDYS